MYVEVLLPTNYITPLPLRGGLANMIRLLTLSAAVLAVWAPSLSAGEITGRYVEARTCDVWTGPCFANADSNLTGKNAVLGWQVETGVLDGVRLDGLGVVAVLAASDTLGLEQTGPAKAVLIVDSRANEAQRAALIRLARREGGKLLQNVVAVQTASVSMSVCDCKGGACAELEAGKAHVKTRCLDAQHDKACGNESAYYPPLARDVTVRPAAASEHSYTGTGLRRVWRDFDRRSGYVGTFKISG
jgi:hypothetical protein